MALNNLFSELLNEFYTLAEMYSKIGVLDDEDTKFNFTKEVSPPEDQPKTCCCDNCTCSKDINRNENVEGYLSTYTTEFSNGGENKETTELLDTNKTWYDPIPSDYKGWVIRASGDWGRSIFVPVDNEHTEVNILDGNRVQIAYEQSVRQSEESVSGYSYQSGSFVFPLPENVNLSTFKAKREGSYLILSVSPKTLEEDTSFVKINIEG